MQSSEISRELEDPMTPENESKDFQEYSHTNNKDFFDNFGVPMTPQSQNAKIDLDNDDFLAPSHFITTKLRSPQSIKFFVEESASDSEQFAAEKSFNWDDSFEERTTSIQLKRINKSLMFLQNEIDLEDGELNDFSFDFNQIDDKRRTLTDDELDLNDSDWGNFDSLVNKTRFNKRQKELGQTNDKFNTDYLRGRRLNSRN